MFTNANVRPANEAVWSATGASQVQAEGNGATENAYGRPHAPRSGAPNNAALSGLHSDISSASELRSATHRLRISDCAPASPRLLGRIRASNRRLIGASPTGQVSEIRRSVWSRRRTAHPSRPPMGWSAVESYSRHQLAAYCSPRFNQLRSTRRVCSAQTKSIPAPIPRTVHRITLTTLQLAPSMTHAPTQATGSANDCIAHQINRNES
jgi:hypothetical protein